MDELTILSDLARRGADIQGWYVQALEQETGASFTPYEVDVNLDENLWLLLNATLEQKTRAYLEALTHA